MLMTSEQFDMLNLSCLTLKLPSDHRWNYGVYNDAQKNTFYVVFTLYYTDTEWSKHTIFNNLNLKYSNDDILQCRFLKFSDP